MRIKSRKRFILYDESRSICQLGYKVQDWISWNKSYDKLDKYHPNLLIQFTNNGEKHSPPHGIVLTLRGGGDVSDRILAMECRHFFGKKIKPNWFNILRWNYLNSNSASKV